MSGSPPRTPVGAVDTDDLRAVVGQDHGRERAGTDPRQLDDFHARQRAGRGTDVGVGGGTARRACLQGAAGSFKAVATGPDVRYDPLTGEMTVMVGARQNRPNLEAGRRARSVRVGRSRPSRTTCGGS